MKPLDPDAESLLRQWIEKPEADLEAAGQLAPNVTTSMRLREIVGFHCQRSLSSTAWLGPFGVRYPGDEAEMLPGDEFKAIQNRPLGEGSCASNPGPRIADWGAEDPLARREPL